MNKLYLIGCALAGCAFLAYDLWLYSTGQFEPLTIIGIGAWVALVLGVCARDAHRSRQPSCKGTADHRVRDFPPPN